MTCDWSRPYKLTLGALAVFAALFLSPQAGAQGDRPPAVATYWHNWTDGDGLSHLTLCNLKDFKLESMAPPADPLWLNSQAPADASVITIVKPVGWKGSWHSDKTVLWVVTLDGQWFVEAEDDTRVELDPGDVVLIENVKAPRDAEGEQGHRSGNIGKEVVKLLVVQLQQPSTIDQPCRFK